VTAIAQDGISYVFAMNADGTGMKSLVAHVPFVSTAGIGTAWMSDSRHIMAIRSFDGNRGGNEYGTVRDEYVIIDVVTGDERVVYTTNYGDDSFNAILYDMSADDKWFLIREVMTTRQAAVISTDNTGAVTTLTGRDKYAAFPVFCGGAFICASTTATQVPQSFPVSRIGFDGKAEELFRVSGWIAWLSFTPAIGS
jgi:hypothetical protein